MKIVLMILSMAVISNAQAQNFKEVLDLNQYSGQFKVTSEARSYRCSGAVQDVSLMMSQSRNDQTSHFRLQSKKTATSEKLLSMTIDEAGGELLTAPVENMDELSDKLTEQGRKFLSNHKNKSENCRLGQAVVAQTQKDLGLVTLIDGQSLQARRTSEHFTGNVICDGRIVGQGTLHIVEIQTQDCEKTTLLQGTTLKLDGKTIQSHRSEVLSLSKAKAKSLLSSN